MDKRAKLGLSLKIMPMGSGKLAGVQGHDLLAAKLASRLGVPHIGWVGSFRQRLIAKLCSVAPSFRGISPRTRWELFVGNVLTHRGVRGRRRIHWIWGDDFIGRARHPDAAILNLHQPMELWPPTHWPAVPRCGGVLTMAQRECDALLERFPGLPVQFIPLGVDTDFWQPDPARVREGPKLICAVGRYMRNFEMFIRVSAALLAAEQDVVVRWLVHPEFVMPPDMASKLPAERFQIVRGLSSGDLRDFYRESWLFFMPYDNVTASNAIVETMACGVPPFTTRVGGMESYARGGAVLVENNDDPAMLDAIRRCLHSRERREALSAAARAVALQSFSWPVVVERHLEFYRTLKRETGRR